VAQGVGSEFKPWYYKKKRKEKVAILSVLHGPRGSQKSAGLKNTEK
jgi:hypothetical protein